MTEPALKNSADPAQVDSETAPGLMDVSPAYAAAAQSQPRFPWRLFFLLAVIMLVSSLLIIPYSIRLASIGTPDIGGQVSTIVIATILQTVLLYLPVLLLGLWVSRRLGLGAPYLHALSERRPVPPGFRRALIFAAVLGFGLGALLLVVAGLFSTVLPSEFTSLSPDQLPNALEGFLASISAGINEEILLRLFLLSLIAWVIQRVAARRSAARRSAGRPGPAVLWAANILAAVIFGLLHLPNVTMMGMSITGMTVVYVIVMNGLAGLGFGWLFWTFGLESAMLAHFFTDIVLHVLAVLFV